MMKRWTIGIILMLLLLSGCAPQEKEPTLPVSGENKTYLLSNRNVDALYQYISMGNIKELLNKSDAPLSVYRLGADSYNDINIVIGETTISIHSDNATGITFQHQGVDTYSTILNYTEENVAKQAFLEMKKENGETISSLYTATNSYALWYDASSGKLTGKALHCTGQACDATVELSFPTKLQEVLTEEMRNFETHLLSDEEKAVNIKVLEAGLHSFLVKNGTNTAQSYYASRYNPETLRYDAERLPQASETWFAQYDLTEREKRVLNTLQVMVKNETEYSATNPIKVTRQMFYPLLHMTPRYVKCDSGTEKTPQNHPYRIACKYEDKYDHSKKQMIEIMDYTYRDRESLLSYVTKTDLNRTTKQVFGAFFDNELVHDYQVDSVRYSYIDQIFNFYPIETDANNNQERYLLLTEVTKKGTKVYVSAIVYDYVCVDGVSFLIGQDGTTYYLNGLNYLEEILSHKDCLQQWEYVLEEEFNDLFRIVSAHKTN